MSHVETVSDNSGLSCGRIYKNIVWDESVKHTDFIKFEK